MGKYKWLIFTSVLVNLVV